MEVGAMAAAATAAGAGAGLFSYNRGNYMMDAKNRYTRYTSGINMAIAQTGMYRQDIADLTNLTVTRQDVYHVVAAMGLTIMTAIYCPGRLGLHTPPPPGWLMGLAFVNIAGAYMFLVLTIWFCMHAAARADTASTHMLTRFVRLPIPSQGMLDKARKFCASYEEQPLSEIFRIPFREHRPSGNEKPHNEFPGADGDAMRRARNGLDVPAWYRVEKEVGRHNTVDTCESMMPLAGKGKNVPEHFDAYRELQAEWFPYDVYSRLCIFLGFMHMTFCWTYMQIGHNLTETRALFSAVIVVLQMFALQQIILTLDIVPMKWPVHRLGPFALWFALFGCVIEYKRWYTPGAQLLGFAFVYAAHVLQIVYTAWLLKICAPSRHAPEHAESPGAAWWPSEWLLPTSFQHAIWLVAPPKELEKGIVDIAGELRDAQSNGSPKAGGVRADHAVDSKRADALRAMGNHGESAAWFNVRTGLLTMLIAWVFMTFGFTIEVITQGTAKPALLSAPGLPNNARDPRYRPAKIGALEVTEVGTGGLHGPARGVHMDAVHRRLAELQLTPEFLANTADQPQIAQALQDLMPHLYELAHTGGQQQAAPPTAQALPIASEPTRLQVKWPALFEPQFLACGTDSPVTVALSRHGSGSLISVPEGPEELVAEATSFILEGVAAHGPLAAASLDAAGLLLMTVTGATLECPGVGPAAHGRWHCSPLPGAKLPISLAGKTLASRIAIARAGSHGLRAAVLYPGDDSVTVFSRATRAAAPWLPSGEVSTSTPMAVPSFTAGAETLLLTNANGGVTHLHMGTGRSSEGTHSEPSMSRHTWPATCQRSTGGFLRLAREQEMAAELVLS